MISHDRRGTSYDLASLFRGMHSTLEACHGIENCKTHWHEAVSSALKFPCLKEVSPNCCVFLHCQFQKIRRPRPRGHLSFWTGQLSLFEKSRKIVSFWSCAHSFVENVSQDFSVSDRQIDR